MKKLIRWLQLWDGVWSIPLLFICVIWVSSLLVQLWGADVGVFPPGLLNASIIASFYLMVGVSLINLVMNLYHRGWWKYYYGKRDPEGRHAKNDFYGLPVWLRIMFIPLLSFLYLLVYCWLIVQLV
jgi:hypothetical protein